MFGMFNAYGDLEVILASLCGAMAYIITQRHFDILRQSVAFFISFSMGIIGEDVTLEIIRFIIPGVYLDSRVFGAFLCSALVITVIISLIAKINETFRKM